MHIKHKLAALLLGLGVVYLASASIYIISDNHSFGDGLWWAFMTFTTVGYGDQYPTSTPGRIAGIVLVATAVFVVLPTITAAIAARIIGNKDVFTHEEQEEVKYLLRRLAKKNGIFYAEQRAEELFRELTQTSLTEVGKK